MRGRATGHGMQEQGRPAPAGQPVVPQGAPPAEPSRLSINLRRL